MKYLCVCSRGNSRSVGLAWILKDHLGLDALAMGIDINGETTKEMLYKWADKIIVVDERLAHKIPTEYSPKVKIFDVGGDRYFRGFEQDLIDQYVRYINEQGL